MATTDTLTAPFGILRRLAELVRRTARDTVRDRVPGLSAEVAFYVVLALPPLLLVVLGVAGYIAQGVGPDVTADIRMAILDGARTFLTESTVEDLTPILDSLLRSGRADVVTFGVVVLVWSGSRAADVVISAVMTAYDRERRPRWLKRRAIALAMTVGGVLGAGVLLPLLVLGPQFGSDVAAEFGWEGAFERAWSLAYWPVVAFAGLVVLTWIYHLAMPHTAWRRELPGAVLALLIWVAGSFGLHYYAGSVIEVDSAYAFFAAPLVILLWVYVTAFAVLVGAELNAEIDKLWPAPRKGSAVTSG